MKTLVIKIHFEMDRNTKKESASLHKIYKWADEIFKSGYTIYKTKGVWNGKATDSFTIERYEKNLKLAEDKNFIKKLKRLKEELKQEEIIITKFIADMDIIK
ncbi:MAG: hypothetical protein BJBARM4_0408 [Candidatus Parvarchaeum acidiphilum ARMAN-4]|jgi:hypothetical protein|uniref:Uncharacterized protein n=1 Tax=Candidatus Parvarchaeum acidiphilum ARMAN-4 TaxID=662760 RepID=D2EF91_PARA4|nr:MAG: hypothetical protein BJBARM4_0408 [Candidatus Parvarchaeum acidiphilum ARMAN-4]